MAINVERLLQRHLDRWAYAFGLSRWRITWELVDGPVTHDEAIAINSYFKRKTGWAAHIKFDGRQLTSDRKVEDAAIHELLHLLDHGIGNDAHKLISRLEGKLRLARKRFSRR